MKLLGFEIGAYVPKKEVKLFEVFQDGQGKFSAQHKSGKWVWVGYNNYVDLMSYSNRERFSTLEKCNQACENFPSFAIGLPLPTYKAVNKIFLISSKK